MSINYNLVSIGNRLTVEGYNNCDPIIRQKLLVLGFTKGTEFSIRRIFSAGELFEIELRDERIILRKQILKMINYKVKLC